MIFSWSTVHHFQIRVIIWQVTVRRKPLDFTEKAGQYYSTVSILLKDIILIFDDSFAKHTRPPVTLRRLANSPLLRVHFIRFTFPQRSTYTVVVETNGRAALQRHVWFGFNYYIVTWPHIRFVLLVRLPSRHESFYCRDLLFYCTVRRRHFACDHTDRCRSIDLICIYFRKGIKSSSIADYTSIKLASEGYVWVVEWWEAKDWGKKRVCNMVGKNIRNYIQYFLHLVLLYLCAFLRTVFVFCVLLSSYVYLLYLMCICCTLCVFVVLYVYLLYPMCICCTLYVFVVLCV